MFSKYNLIWCLFLLKEFLFVKNFNIDRGVHLGSEYLNSLREESLLKPYVTIKEVDNITIINAYNLPRACGKTTLLTQCIDKLQNEYCAYINSNMYATRNILRSHIKNIYCKGYSQDSFLLNCGISYQHFFFDEFGRPKNYKDIKEFHKEVTEHAMKKILDKSKPSYIVFIHRTSSDAF